jgi:kynurenine formamidase
MSDYDTWIASQGGRRPFGADDRLGTANYINPAARRRGAASIGTGECLTLARPLVDSAAASGSDRHDYELDVSVVEGPVGFATDHLELRCHGLVNTHLDALNHISVDGTFYGGRRAGDADLSSVADLATHGLFTRGVLADIPSSRGTGWVEADQPVTGDDIERSLGDARFESGDALLLYMGRDLYESAGLAFDGSVRPGAGRSAAEWIADHHVSLVCWDFLDAGDAREPHLCIHRLIWALGLLLVDNCDLSRAAAALRDRPAPVGALAVSPIAVPAGTGCTVTPLLVV